LAFLRGYWLAIFLTALGVCLSAEASPAPRVVSSSVHVPHLSGEPKLEDFLGMAPQGDVALQMAREDGFLQREPHDGEAASQRTEAYLGYDAGHLFVVFVCFDGQQGRVRAHMTRRENLHGEDTVGVYLDTFLDRRRSYAFVSNPLGVQRDMIWTESGGPDDSFDTVWDSQGRRTKQGYVVLLAIPFKSLRFPAQEGKRWGIVLQRKISRSGEVSSWPYISSKLQGLLTQEAELDGLNGISSGRNLTLTPYGVMRSFKQLDLRDDTNPHYTSKRIGGTGGLDAKAVLHQSFVLDATFNPDFSQVESDEPQSTANQRFEVYFPEKRPFFLENSDYFQGPSFTPEGMNFFQPRESFVFTRNILDPEFGLRLTGKTGPYSLGLLVSDDRGPGESVGPADPNFRKRAHFAVARVQREIGGRASIGLFYTDREFDAQYNRVAGLDARLKLGDNWVASAGADYSSTIDSDGLYSTGPAYDLLLDRKGRQFDYSLEYHDTSPGFITDTGFFRRPDIRRVIQSLNYNFRPEGKRIVSWGPHAGVARSYDYTGLLLDELYGAGGGIEFARQIHLEFGAGATRETLRPKDYSALPANKTFGEPYKFIGFFAQPLPSFSMRMIAFRSASINYNPPDGVAPYLADEEFIESAATVRPLTALGIENSYLLDRLRDRQSHSVAFTNHILRSKWNYQFTRKLSARIILQYSAVLSNPLLSSLSRTKGVNGDFLITYLVHPGTALYIGYNSNLENINPALCQRLPAGPCDAAGPGLLYRNGPLLNDGRLFFVKLSYQFRY